MKTLHIIPGSGGNFYCQNCLRDNLLVRTLREQGHDAVTVPLYLPMFSDDPTIQSDIPLFFPAISLYLKYKFPFLKKIPHFFTRFFDSSFFLKMAALKAGSTNADGLEGMTISMLKGEEGEMNDELQRLIKWISETERPDIVHISNALLLSIAGPLKKVLDIPVVCSLQDEKQWVDSVKEPFRTEIWELIAEKAEDVDMFISVSEYYAQEMKKNLKIPEEKMEIVYIGIDLKGYDLEENVLGSECGINVAEGEATVSSHGIGYLSKISEAMGFGILVDAFIELKKEDEFKDLKLIATGGLLDDGKLFIREIRKKLRSSGFENDLKIIEYFDADSRKDFFRSISLLSVPIPGGEAFGTYMLEAMASRVPVVQPDEGAYPEIIEKTGGGVIYSPNDSSALADALKKLLRNPQKIKKLGIKGQKSVLQEFSIQQMAEQTSEIYKTILADT